MSEQSGPQQVRSRSARGAHLSGPQMTPVYYSVIRVGAHLTTPAILPLQVRSLTRREATHTARSAERRCAAFGDIPATRSCGGRGSE
jgi:hypothetical protein